MDADNLAIRKQIAQYIQRDSVIGIVEGRHQNQAIGDIKIGVAGGQSLSAEDHGAGKRQFNDLQLASLQICGGAQTPQVFLQRLVVGVVLVGFDHGEHGIRGDEARNVIDVAVRVVALDAAAQPDYFFYSQIISKDLFQLSRCQSPGCAAALC